MYTYLPILVIEVGLSSDIVVDLSPFEQLDANEVVENPDESSAVDNGEDNIVGNFSGDKHGDSDGDCGVVCS